MIYVNLRQIIICLHQNCAAKNPVNPNQKFICKYLFMIRSPKLSDKCNFYIKLNYFNLETTKKSWGSKPSEWWEMEPWFLITDESLFEVFLLIQWVLTSLYSFLILYLARSPCTIYISDDTHIKDSVSSLRNETLSYWIHHRMPVSIHSVGLNQSVTQSFLCSLIPAA